MWTTAYLHHSAIDTYRTEEIMIRLSVLTVRRIIEGMLDAEDRRLIAQATVIVVAAVLGLIVFAAAAGVALAIFRATGGL